MILMRYLITIVLFTVNAFAAINTEQLNKLKQEAEEGDDLAQFDLGIRYFNGENVPKNEGEAFKWFSRAAEKENGLAQFYLAVCYAEGRGVDKDLSRCAYWRSKAESKGITRDESAPNIKININTSDKTGSDDQGSAGAKPTQYIPPKDSPLIPKNPDAPIDESEPTDAKAQYEKGRQYFAQKNIAEAAKWYLKAAEQGIAGAQFGLAICYTIKSPDFKQDQVEATKWFIKCAQNGWYHAQYHAATRYKSGIGIEVNMVESYAYISLAVEKNYPAAIKLRAELEAKLSPSEIEAGLKRKSELAAIIELNKASAKSSQTKASNKEE